MNHPRLLMSKLALGLVAALAAAPAFAQSTSAGVGGQVLSNAGQPVIGAEVVITHNESGTVSRATTDASGRYNARGLRVGGLYTITITIFSAELKKYKTHREIIQALSSLDYIYHIEELR